MTLSGMTMFLLLSAVLASQSPAASDPRSSDAVAMFDDMCVRTLLGEKSAINPQRFVIMKVDERDARETLPEFDPDTAWGVVGRDSNVRMFIGSGRGICSAEVMSADQTSMRSDFDELIVRVARELQSPAKLEMQNDAPINGKPASYRAWRLKSPKGDIMLALTAASEGAADVQHFMTASYVK
jgi:hypothetical protein